MKTVEIFTDGACSGNPGPGGWGAILRYGTAEKELSGGEHETTNNRMELSGVIAALSALKEPCHVLLTTDSKYVVDSVTKGWVYGWQKRGWVKSDKKPALNVDLWKQLLPLLEWLRLESSGFLRVLLGSVFDPADVACYFAGCLLLGLWELLRWRQARRRPS